MIKFLFPTTRKDSALLCEIPGGLMCFFWELTIKIIQLN